MNDEEIIKALLMGNHLDKSEMHRAKQLVHSMQLELDYRVN